MSIDTLTMRVVQRGGCALSVHSQSLVSNPRFRFFWSSFALSSSTSSVAGPFPCSEESKPKQKHTRQLPNDANKGG